MSHKNHPNMKTTFEKLMVQAVTLREEHTKTHGGVFDIYEFAKEYGVISINYTGDDIIIRASDDTHQIWECDIPGHHSEDVRRFILAMLTGWVVLRSENSPTEFTINDPTSRTGGYDSSEEIDAELFAYALMVPDDALDDASITPLYDGSLSKLAEAVRAVKEGIASKLGVPPIVVENYVCLRWSLYQAKKQESLRASLEAAHQKRLVKNKRNNRSTRRMWGD